MATQKPILSNKDTSHHSLSRTARKRYWNLGLAVGQAEREGAAGATLEQQEGFFSDFTSI
jgi:hypothetical protein